MHKVFSHLRRSSGNLGKLGTDVVCEGTELFDVNGLTGAEVVVQVGDETPPDNRHLWSIKRVFLLT